MYVLKKNIPSEKAINLKYIHTPSTSQFDTMRIISLFVPSVDSGPRPQVFFFFSVLKYRMKYPFKLNCK